MLVWLIGPTEKVKMGLIGFNGFGLDCMGLHMVFRWWGWGDNIR